MPMAHQTIAILLASLRASARTPMMIMTAFLISTDDLPFNYLAAIDTDGDGYPDEYLSVILTVHQEAG